MILCILFYIIYNYNINQGAVALDLMEFNEATARRNNTATCVDVEAVANRLQHWVRFGRPWV